MKIYFDMDGVLADYDAGIHKDPLSIEAVSKHDEAYAMLSDKYKKMAKSTFAKALASKELDPELAAYKQFKTKMNHTKNQLTLQPGFFENLPLMPGAMEMVDATGKLFGTDLNILSTPITIPEKPEIREQCIKEKTNWLNRHFPGRFKQIIFEKDKYKYATPNTILIDDRSDNTRKFKDAGGNVVLFVDSSQALRDLEELSRGSRMSESLLRKYLRLLIKG